MRTDRLPRREPARKGPRLLLHPAKESSWYVVEPADDEIVIETSVVSLLHEKGPRATRKVDRNESRVAASALLKVRARGVNGAPQSNRASVRVATS